MANTSPPSHEPVAAKCGLNGETRDDPETKSSTPAVANKTRRGEAVQVEDQNQGGCDGGSDGETQRGREQEREQEVGGTRKTRSGEKRNSLQQQQRRPDPFKKAKVREALDSIC